MSFSDKVLFVIPARKNSERFPGKSLALLNKTPLIAHSVTYAQALIQQHVPNAKLVISSNDEQVKDWAVENGIEYLDRPDELASPWSTTISALKNVSSTIDDYDYMVVLQLTNPLRPESLFKDAFSTLLDARADSLFTVSESTRKLGRVENGRFEPYNYNFGQRSQDMDSLYFENGLLYIASKVLIDSGVLMNEKSIPFIVDHPFGWVDIDIPIDLKFAEHILYDHG